MQARRDSRRAILSGHDLQSRRFARTWGSLIALALVAFPLLSLGVLNRHDMAELFWIHETTSKKAQLLNLEKDRPAPRLLVIGGSGAIYGIDATLLERRLGMPCFNVGTHAGLGLQYHLRNAEKLLRPGDIALLAIEHHLFYVGEDPLNEQQWGYYFTFDRSHIFARPLISIARLLYLSPPETYRTSIENWDAVIRGEFDAKRYTAAQNRGAIYLSPRGDVQIVQGGPSAIKVPRSYARGRFPQEVATSLGEFRKWCEAHGVRVLATPPNAVIPSSGLEDIEAATLTLQRELAALEIASVGGTTDAAFPLPFFYDTSYHLHAAGRRVRTELLARRLQETLRQPSAPAGSAAKMPSETLLLSFGWQDSLRNFSDDGRFATADFRLWTDAQMQHPSTIDAAALRKALALGRPAFTADETGLPILEKAGFRTERVEHHAMTFAELIRLAQDKVLFYAFSPPETAAVGAFRSLPTLAEGTASGLQVGVCGFGRWDTIRQSGAGSGEAKIEEFDRARISGGALPPYFKTEAIAAANATTVLKVQVGRYGLSANSGGIVVIYDPTLGMIENVHFTTGGIAKLGSLYRITPHP